MGAPYPLLHRLLQRPHGCIAPLRYGWVMTSVVLLRDRLQVIEIHSCLKYCAPHKCYSRARVSPHCQEYRVRALLQKFSGGVYDDPTWLPASAKDCNELGTSLCRVPCLGGRALSGTPTDTVHVGYTERDVVHRHIGQYEYHRFRDDKITPCIRQGRLGKHAYKKARRNSNNKIR